MIVKNHNILLQDTSEAEMARFRQIMLGVWRQQIEDDRNAREMEQYLKQNDIKQFSETLKSTDFDNSKFVDSNSNANGYYYNKNGKFEVKINIANNKGNSNDVYVCDKKGNEKGTFFNAIKLDITHEIFCYIAGVIKAEDSSSFESAAATTQATFNAVKFEKGDELSIKQQGELAKKLLSTGYSTATSKKMLEDSENDNFSNNARKGLIHVLQGKKDYSEEGILWDGIDFADKGIAHNKAKKDGGISITRELWLKFVTDSEYKLDSKGVPRLNRHPKGKDGKGHDIDKTKEQALATIPFEEEKNTSTKNYYYNIFDFGEKKNSTWDVAVDSKEVKNLDYYETTGTGKYNEGRTLNKATAVVGRHIFWKPYKEHPNNKGYAWEYFMDHKL